MSTDGKQRRQQERKDERARAKKSKRKKNTSSSSIDLTLNGLSKVYKSMPKQTKKYIKWVGTWGAIILSIVVIVAIFGNAPE